MSQASEGWTAVVARVDGDDGCDPADPRSRREVSCAEVIETRSAEFPRPDPAELSPEQRLLAEQRDRMVSNQAAARRLAANGGNPDDLRDQGIASIALRGAIPVARNEEEERPAELSSDVAAIVQAIANAATGPR